MPEYRAIEGSDGEQDITVTATVTTLTIPKSKMGNISVNGRAIVECRDADILYTINGVDPPSDDRSGGQRLPVESVLLVVGSEMAALKMVRAKTPNGAVQVRYERRVS